MRLFLSVKSVKFNASFYAVVTGRCVNKKKGIEAIWYRGVVMVSI